MSIPAMPSTANTTTNAGPPFNKTTADAILRTSDNVDFWIRRSILAEASPVFEDMLSIPQPPLGSANSDEEKDGLPIIRLSENSTTIDKLLRLCYPTDDPKIDSLDELRPVLQAALKYMMQESTSLLRRRLVKLGEAQPLRAFAIACSLELDAEAEVLAPLAHSVHGTFVEELRTISAGVYYRIVHYLPRPGTKSSKQAACGPSRSNLSPPSVQTNVAPRSKCQPQYIPPALLGSPTADVIVRTTDKVDLHLHSAILSLASPVLRDLIADCHDEDAGWEYVAPIYLPEDSRTITTLLRHVYPLPRPTQPTALSELSTLLSAAYKYDMLAAIDALRSQLLSFLPTHDVPEGKSEHAGTDALRVFALAHQYRFLEVRAAAAHALLRLPREDLRNLYVEELEDVSAEAYFRLLEYHDKCCQVASARVLAHALTSAETRISSAPPSPMTSGRGAERANSRDRNGGSAKGNKSRSASHPSNPFPGVWSAGPSNPGSILTTNRGHTYTCHVLLDETSSAAWAHFRTHSTPRWWIMYLYKVALMLRQQPWGQVALDPGLRQRAIARALECECCRGVFLPGFQEYAENLAREVNRAVAKVGSQ